MIKVSVIVPVYGVEKYIRRCAESLFSQTLEDMEFIFVNDCTKDNSIEILKDVIYKFPERKDNIHIINHDINKGLPRARQTGVQAATGEYIAHCDSDDWVDLDMYRLLYESAKSRNLDLIKCSHVITDCLGHNTVVAPYYQNNIIQKRQVISDLLTCKGWNSVWDILVKRSLYDEYIEFAPCTMLEDFYLSTQLLIRAQEIGVIDTPLYYYYQNQESICGKNDDSSYINRALQAKTNILCILEFISKEFGYSQYRKEVIALKFIPYRLLFPIMNKNHYENWNMLFKEIKLNIIFSPFITIKEKITFYLIEFHLYRLYIIMVFLLKKFYHSLRKYLKLI